jgi:surfactin synthase thioesterase subunit
MIISIFEKHSDIDDLRRPAQEYWWWPKGSPHSTRPTILYFGGAGEGHTTNLVRVFHPLITSANIGAWKMPGRGDRSQESHPSNIRKLAQEIASTIVGLKLPRPILVGYSAGGLLAYLVCQELERSDFRVGRIVQVASLDPLQWRLISAYALIRGGFDAYSLKLLRKFEDDGAWPPTPIPDPLRMSVARQRAVADGRLALQYVRHSRVATPITDISASDDQIIKFNNPRRWKRFTTGEFESIIVTGDHYFYRNVPEKLPRILTNVADHAYNSY